MNNSKKSFLLLKNNSSNKKIRRLQLRFQDLPIHEAPFLKQLYEANPSWTYEKNDLDVRTKLKAGRTKKLFLDVRFSRRTKKFWTYEKKCTKPFFGRTNEKKFTKKKFGRTIFFRRLQLRFQDLPINEAPSLKQLYEANPTSQLSIVLPGLIQGQTFPQHLNSTRTARP